MNYQLLEGDCIDVMKTLPANSVQCCVTSPPYYGLRDYQTATWEGGDPGCDHVERKKGNTRDGLAAAANAADGGKRRQENRADNDNSFHGEQYRDLCGKCGAKRIDRQIGLEEAPEAYVAKLVDVFREVRRLLHPSGTVWLNIGDSYNGSGGAGGDYSAGGLKEGQPKYPGRNIKGLGPKQLLGIPWRVAFALQADGWVLRSEVIWHKRAPMPESVTDRPTKAHEQVFLLAKSANYFYDAEAIAEQALQPSGIAVQTAQHKQIDLRRRENMQSSTLGTNQGAATRNKRSVWTLGPEPYSGAHFATMPTKLVEPCILAGSRAGDTVLDPFNGAATTGIVALRHHRNYIGIDLNPDYLELSRKRLAQVQPMLLEATP